MAKELKNLTEEQLLDMAFDCYIDGNDELLDQVTDQLHEIWNDVWKAE